MVHAQVVAAVQEERLPVPPEELDEGVTPDDVTRIAGHRDHEVEDDVVGEQVKEVLVVGVVPQPLLDDAEEGGPRRGSPPSG
jgi:hypothetical protein